MEPRKKGIIAALGLGGLASTCNLVASTTTTIDAAPGAWKAMVDAAKSAQAMVEATATTSVISATGMVAGFGGAILLWSWRYLTRRFPRLAAMAPGRDTRVASEQQPLTTLGSIDRIDELRAHTDGRFSQQQRSIDANANIFNQQLAEMQKKLDHISTSSELGEIAYRSINAMLALRMLRHPITCIRGYVDAIRGFPAKPAGGQIDYFPGQLTTIRMNLEEIVGHWKINGVDGLSDLKEEIRKMDMERDQRRLFEDSSRMAGDERYDRERTSLLKDAEIVYSSIAKIRTRYQQLCRAPSTTLALSGPVSWKIRRLARKA